MWHGAVLVYVHWWCLCCDIHFGVKNNSSRVKILCKELEVSMSSTRIAIVNYQAGNLRSVQKALEKFGVCTEITSDVDQNKRADGLVFPGQGSCDSSMMQLYKNNLIDPIREYISTNKPFLGICLGLQLLLLLLFLLPS